MYTVYKTTLVLLCVFVHLPHVLTDVLRNAEVFTGQQLAAQQKPIWVCLLFMQTVICKECGRKVCLVRCHLFSSSSWLAFMSCCQ